jgi:hypothetical protein
MLDAPRHDWTYYEACTRASDREFIRALTTSERFAIYASFFDTVWRARQSLPGDWDRLERERLERKLIVRQTIVDALRKMDKLERGRSST